MQQVYYKVRTVHKTSKPSTKEDALDLYKKWKEDYRYVEVIKYDSRGNSKVVASTIVN